MDVETVGRTLGFSLAAGVNLYATVAILGLAARYGWVDLPPQFQVFNHDVVIGAAIVMYLIEFLADKVPYFDSLWDGIHTVIRPIGGALIAVGTLGDASPMVEGLVALQYPVAALIVTAVAIVLIVVFAAAIVRTVRRWFRRWFAPRAPAASSG